MGLPVAGSVALAVGVAASTAWSSPASAAVTAQLTEHCRPANGMAFAALGAGLPAPGRRRHRPPQLSWLSWLSPIGWAERFRPFAGERWWVLLLPGGRARGPAGGGRAALLVRRDVGAGVLATRLGPADRAALAAQPARPWPGGSSAASLPAGRSGSAVAGLSFGADRPGHGAVRRPGPARPPSSWPLPRRGRQHHRRLLSGRDPHLDRHARRRLRHPGHPAAAGRGGRAPGRAGAGHRDPPGRVGRQPPGGGRRWARRSCSPPAGCWPGWPTGCRAGDVGGELPRVLGGALVQLPAVWVLAAVGVALFGLLPRLVVGATWAALAVVAVPHRVRGGAPAQPVAARPVAVRPPAEAAGGRVHGHAPGLAAGRQPRSWPPPAWPASAAATWSAAPDHIDAMSLSTRSSWARKGSLHRTVRWAWSLSLRWTQSTV